MATPADLVFDGIDLALKVANVIIDAFRGGETKAVAIQRARAVLDRAEQIDRDVDDVAAGRA